MSNALRARFDKLRKTDKYWIDSVKLDFAVAIEAKRREYDRSYTDLARAMGTSNAYISKVFRGDANLTIDSMVKIARAVGCNINIEVGKDISIRIVSVNSQKYKQEISIFNSKNKNEPIAINDENHSLAA